MGYPQLKEQRYFTEALQHKMEIVWKTATKPVITFSHLMGAISLH
jgi:hypothetical protein